MATLYFYGLDDTVRRSWQTASYWKTTDSPSGTASATIPASGDTVVIRRRVTNVPATLNLNSITIDIPQNKTYPTSDYGVPIVEFANCTNLTTASGINVIWNNNIVTIDYESNAFAYFGTPLSGTYNTSFNFNFDNKTFSENYNSTVFHRTFSSTTTPTNLLFNGNISITGIPTSGSYMPTYNGQFIHNSGNLTLQNVSTQYVFGSLACRRTGNTGYTIYASGCRFFDPTASSSFYGGIPNDGTKRLECSSATFNDCRVYSINSNNNIYYFGSGVQSINIDSTPYDNKIWPNPSLPYLNINTSGSTNVFFTNTNNALITHTIANTGNISLVNSTLKSLYWKPTQLKGINANLYIDSTSKIDNASYDSTSINELISISGYNIITSYPNRYPILASGNYTVSYSGYPSPRTLYFNNATNDNNILTLGNWWNDSAHTSAATELPYHMDNVVVSGVQIAEADIINFNELVVYDGSIDLSSSGIFCVGSGGTVLNGSSNIIDPQLMKTSNGLVLNNTSYINGNNLGPIGIYGSGSFNANDDSKYIGDASKIFLTTNWNGLDGWDITDSIYYIGGRPTALDSSGNGWDSYTNTYYLNGIATTLDSNGSGFYDGHAYYYASLQPTGWNGYYYYVDDVQTTLDQYAYGSWNGLFYNGYPALLTGWDWNYYSGYYIDGIVTSLDSNGSGFWEGHAYYNGYQQPTGYNGYYYYINDVETSLDYNGSGFWDGHAYYYGGLQPTGWNDYGYYIDDVFTDLDSSGTGNWDGYYWYNGVRQVVGSVFTGADGDWDNLANWIDSNGYAATELPNSGTDITVTTSITTIATQNPTVNSLIVENTAIISIDITVTTSSTFNDSSSYSGAYHLYSDTVIFNDSSSAGGNIHPTTSITFNNNSSASSLALDPLRVYLEPGYLNITGFPINPTSLNISNDTANSTNSTSFSRAGLGVNGSNILGLI